MKSGKMFRYILALIASVLGIVVYTGIDLAYPKFASQKLPLLARICLWLLIVVSLYNIWNAGAIM